MSHNPSPPCRSRPGTPGCGAGNGGKGLHTATGAAQPSCHRVASSPTMAASPGAQADGKTTQRSTRAAQTSPAAQRPSHGALRAQTPRWHRAPPVHWLSASQSGWAQTPSSQRIDGSAHAATALQPSRGRQTPSSHRSATQQPASSAQGRSPIQLLAGPQWLPGGHAASLAQRCAGTDASVQPANVATSAAPTTRCAGQNRR